MNQQSINIFLAIVEHQSISAAARELHFSQQAVSDHLNKLEKKLGFQLVQRERGNRKITLTQAGNAFVPLARQHSELELQVAQLAQMENHNLLRVGSSINGHEYIISHIMYKLLRSCPEIDVQLGMIEFDEMPTSIKEPRFDVIFRFGCFPEPPHFQAIHVFDEDRYIICPADTPLPDRVLSIDELDPRFEIRYDTFGTAEVSKTWRKQHFPEDVKPYSRVSRLMFAHQHMTDPRCWMLSSASNAVALSRTNPDKLVIRQVSPPPPSRVCNLLVSKTYPETKIIRELLRCCDEYTAETSYLHKPSP